MQKKLIALAVAAVVSTPAFADVTPYGIIDAAIANVSATNQKSDLLALSGGASSSRIGAKVTEDLGDGLTVVGVIEYGLDTETNQQSAPTTSTTLTNTTVTPNTTVTGVKATSTTSAASNLKARQQMLALAGSFGTVATGYLQTTGYDFGVKFDPLAGSLASPLQNVTVGGGFLIGSAAGAARAQRAVAYISPDFNGLSFAVNYTTSFDNALGNLKMADTATTGLKTTAYLLSGSYAAGPLNVGLVYLGTANASTAADTATEVALGGSYDFGVAKLLATYQSQTVTPGAAGATSYSDKALSLSGVIPVGADAVAVSYAKSSMDAVNTNGSSYTVGYLHTMTKTTTVYAAYSATTNDSGTGAYSVANGVLGTSLTNGGNSSLIGFGMRKKF